MLVELVINGGERVIEFLFSLALGDEPRLLEGKYNCRGAVETKVWQLAPNPAEWGTGRGNDGNWDLAKGESLKLSGIGPSQVKGCGRERLRRLKDRIDVKSNLVLEHVCVENDPNIELENFPDHPSKGDAGETMTLAICYRSTPDV